MHVLTPLQLLDLGREVKYLGEYTFLNEVKMCKKELFIEQKVVFWEVSIQCP